MNSTVSAPRPTALPRARDRCFAAAHTGLLAALAMAVAVGRRDLCGVTPSTSPAMNSRPADLLFPHWRLCGGLLGFVMSVVGSIGYLFTRHLEWDRVSQATLKWGPFWLWHSGQRQLLGQTTWNLLDLDPR